MFKEKNCCNIFSPWIPSQTDRILLKLSFATKRV
jgi:hypothetical protein